MNVHVVSPASVRTAGEIGISLLGTPLNNSMLASVKGRSSKTHPLPSLGAVYRKRSSLDRDWRLSTNRYLDKAGFDSSPTLRLAYLPISWIDDDEMRNSSAEAWRVWDVGTVVEETRAGDSDLDEATSNFWELDENNRWRIFLAPDLGFLGLGEDIIDGNVEDKGWWTRVSGVLLFKVPLLQIKTLTSMVSKSFCLVIHRARRRG